MGGERGEDDDDGGERGGHERGIMWMGRYVNVRKVLVMAVATGTRSIPLVRVPFAERRVQGEEAHAHDIHSGIDGAGDV